MLGGFLKQLCSQLTFPQKAGECPMHRLNQNICSDACYWESFLDLKLRAYRKIKTWWSAMSKRHRRVLSLDQNRKRHHFKYLCHNCLTPPTCLLFCLHWTFIWFIRVARAKSLLKEINGQEHQPRQCLLPHGRNIVDYSSLVYCSSQLLFWIDFGFSSTLLFNFIYLQKAIWGTLQNSLKNAEQ